MLFALPFLIGNVLQHLYHSIDALIVEMAVGSNAYNGVMQSGKVSSVMVSFFLGISVGAGVVVSQYFGAKDKENLKKSVHTTIILSLVFGALLTGLGLLFSKYILMIIGTKEEAFAFAKEYLDIYFVGIVFLVIYNMGAGILRAIGDTVTPLIFLGITALFNIGLDLLMTPKMGVAGAAWATVIAQAASALMVLLRLFLTKQDYRLRFRDFKPDWKICKKIFKVGIPTGLQNSVVSVAHLVMTGFINQFSTPEITGTYHYQMIDGFIYLPFNSFAVSLSTFVGQNAGAGRYDRVKKAVKSCLLINMAMTVLLGGLMLLFGERIMETFAERPSSFLKALTMTLFSNAADNELMVNTSLKFMKVLVFSYPILVITDTLAAAIRGSGQALVPALITIGGMCVFRIIFIVALMPFFHDILIVYLSYTASWTFATAGMTIYYFKGKWRNKSIIDKGADAQTPPAEAA